MKKLMLLLGLIFVLSGCSLFEKEQPAPVIPEQAPSPQVWGEMPSEPAQAAEVISALEETPAPTPEPTPEPLPDFEAVQVQGPMVQLQYPDAESRSSAPYLEVESLLIDDRTYVRASDLSKVYPWFRVEENEKGVSFSTMWDTVTDSYGEAVMYDGTRLEGLDNAVAAVETAEGTEYWVPLRAVSGAVGLYLLWDEAAQVSYVAQLINTSLIAQGVQVPTLMYHEVGDELWGLTSLFVSPSNMRAQLQYLQDNGYDPIWFSDLTHLEDYDKPVLLTFDDGYIGNYTNLLPLLQEFNMKATVFIIIEKVGNQYYFDEAQALELANSGLVSVQSHTVTHRELAMLSTSEQNTELYESQLAVARITGRTPYVICYPSGSFNGTTVDLGEEYYTFGLKMNGGRWTTDNDDLLTIERHFVSRSTGLSSFAGLVS